MYSICLLIRSEFYLPPLSPSFLFSCRVSRCVASQRAYRVKRCLKFHRRKTDSKFAEQSRSGTGRTGGEGPGGTSDAPCMYRREIPGRLCVIPLYRIRLYIHLPFSLKRHPRPSCVAAGRYSTLRLVVAGMARVTSNSIDMSHLCLVASKM